MQNQQLTPSQTSLQQSSNSLQPNNNSLQQSGAPAGSSDNAMILNQPLNTQLQVQSAQTDPSLQPQTYIPMQISLVWVLIIGAVLFIAGAVALRRFAQSGEAELEDTTEDTTDVSPQSPPKQSPKATSKKPKYQKKTTRRQRSRKT